MTAPAMAPAYTAVMAPRLTLAQTVSQHSVASHNSAAKQSTEWPDTVKNYVRRSFAPENMSDDVSRKEMEVQLKATITRAAENGNLLDVDWDNYPLPQQIVLQIRAQQNTYHSWHQSVSPPTNKKKRSFDEHTNGYNNNVGSADGLPPWRKGKGLGNESFESRVTYSNKNQNTRNEKKQKKQQTMEPSSKFKEELEQRRQRFMDKSPRSSSSSYSKDEVKDTTSMDPVVGSCQDIFKSYFRLTRPPRAHEVRPQSVLEQALKALKQQWRQKSEYNYVCDQLKSIRQDLFVQHIKNAFTVEVYETHAVIALEKGDLGEYNQCQTQLRALYLGKLGGRPAEFTAYRILYFIHTGVRTDLNETLAELTPADKQEIPIKHALKVRSAVALGNYHKLFMLYHECPNMGPYLMDAFVNRERLSALAKMCKAYKSQELSIRLVSEELGFESYEDAAQFLITHGAQQCLKQTDEDLVLITTLAFPIFEEAKNKASRSVDIKGQI